MPAADKERWVSMVVDTVLVNVDTISQIPKILETVLEYSLDEASEISDTLQDPGAIDLIRRFSGALEGRDQFTFDDFHAIVNGLKQATKRKGKQLFHPLRAALSGKSSGPELDKLIPLIETASNLGIKNILSCKNRVQAFLARHG